MCRVKIQNHAKDKMASFTKLTSHTYVLEMGKKPQGERNVFVGISSFRSWP